MPKAPEGYYYKYEPNGDKGRGYYLEEEVEGVAPPTTAPKFISYAAILKKVDQPRPPSPLALVVGTTSQE
jgi:hypothetical protein